MSELQATVEFSIELHKFYNVDLFQRGFYQVRTSLKVSPKLSVRIEVNLARSQTSEHVFSPFVANGCGVSRVFQILYRNQEVLLDNVILFRVHMLVDSHKIEETLEKADFSLNVELWFTEQPYMLSQQNGTSCVSIRTLHFHFSPVKGLHYHLPVLFDYFHLAAVTITIHAILVALHQPYINNPRSAKPFFGTPYRLHSRHPQSMDTLFFGSMNSTKCVSSGARLAHARHIHQEVCSVLLATYDTLQSNLHNYMKLLPSWQQLKLETNDCLKRLNNLSDNAKHIETEDDFISVANSDIAQLCAENILLWQQFLDTFTCKVPILQHLAKYHHQLRVKRFSEAFFVVDNPRQSAAGCYDANYQNYLAVSETVRRSRYLASLPPLPVTCVELDGDIATMPIIFEDQYQDVAEFARRRNDASRKSGIDPFLNSISEPIASYSIKEEDCSCGIVAILESRSQKNSSGLKSTSQRNYSSSKLNPQVSLRSLKMVESTIDEDNVVKATLTIGSCLKDKELMENISTLLLKYKEQKNKKIGDIDSHKVLSVRQRHSKSLDQLKNTGIHVSQVPNTTSVCITRSTSSHMPYSIPNAVSKASMKDYLAVETNSVNYNVGETSSLQADFSCKKFEQSLSAPYGLYEYPSLRNNHFYSSNNIKHSESTLSMPNANGFLSEKFNDIKFFIGNSSESMPNLIQSPTDSPKSFGLVASKFRYKKYADKDILALYKINDSIIIEETADDPATEIKPPKLDPLMSSPLSSISDELTSEQSGWVSNSSRHSSGTRSSSGALSPETTFNRKELPDYSTLQLKKINSYPLEPVLDGDELIEKLEKLALRPEKLFQLNCETIYEDLRVPPPQQFRDAPTPPEHFRDPPVISTFNNESNCKDSVDNLLYHFYESDVEKTLNTKSGVKSSRNLKASLENLAYDIFKESKRRDWSHSKRNKRKVKEKKLKVTSDKGFKKQEGKYNDSDTSTAESTNFSTKKNGEKPKTTSKFKNPFQGYLFKEDIETLQKTLGTENNKNKFVKTKVHELKNSVINKKLLANGETESYFDNEPKEKNESDCYCYDKDEKYKNNKLESETLIFKKAKEDFKKQMNFTGMIYSDFPTLASTLPYFHISDEYRIFSPEGLHLIICVHGLDGNSSDLRLVKTYLELGLPGANLEFLMSERNQGDTFSDFDSMTDKLVAEILCHIETCGPTPSRISFIGHSLGNIIIRSAITRPQLKHLLPRFHTFLSLSGPHLGTLYNNSGLVNMGMWFMQKWKKSGSLLQLSLKDASDIRQTFLYRLSQKSNLHFFKHVLLCGSSQDRYVPMHSARIELCKAAIKDSTIQGVIYREMVRNIMNPVINSTNTTLVRYDIHHALPNTANSLIGRAAHIAVLDSELFIEKFLVVTGLKYFR